jgi:phage repressor protein C with HTH and peptisase S24 domain
MQTTTHACIFLDMTTGNRIAAAREAENLNQSELARALGVSPQSVQAWESDKNTPRPKRLKEIAKILGVSAGYLMGEDDQEGKNKGGVIEGRFRSRRAREGEIEIPQYDVRASMGHGQVVPSDYVDTIRHITVSADFLLEQGIAYTKPGNLAVITGFGESMNKTFSNGDPLIIDRGVNSVVTDGVYLFTLLDALFVKRLQRLPNGVRVISDNDSFPPYEVAGEDVSQLVIHARVLLAWRSQRL